MERRKILVVTKTYPSISTKYRETVCTAGILLDNNEKPLEWIRIYPIPYRYIEANQKFPRWAIISAEIERNPKDYRAESFRVNYSSIRIVRKIGTENNWKERKELILPFQFKSTKDIQEQNKSLGIIKPKIINKYYHQKTSREWSDKQKAVLDQLDLFEPSIPLDKIPYKFYYDFMDEDGINHKYSISDWEISELYRKCCAESKANSPVEKEQEGLAKVKQKLEGFISKNDLYFVIGNLKNHSQSFMIIGLFYPLIVKSEQLNLFDLL